MLRRADGMGYCLRMHLPRGSRFALGTIALPVLLSVLGCPNTSAKRTADGKKGSVLAQIDDVSITVSELEDRINSQTPYVRARYTGVEQKKEFLENLVKFEVLASEARRQGLDHDPEVVRVERGVWDAMLGVWDVGARGLGQLGTGGDGERKIVCAGSWE